MSLSSVKYVVKKFKQFGLPTKCDTSVIFHGNTTNVYITH